MKILFIIPAAGRKFPFSRRHSFFDAAVPILTALTPDHVEVEVVDENIESIDYEADADVVMITIPFSPRAERVYSISKEFKRRGKKTVLGGAHVWFFSEEALLYADSIVVGEAEGVWGELIEDLSQGTLKKLYQSSRFVGLQDAPRPRYDLLKLERYLIAPIQTTRGCPNHCKFCAMWKYQGNRLRHKSVAAVVEEIEFLKRHPFRPFDWLPIHIDKLFFFIDLNFCIDAKYTRALLEKVAGLNISYWAQTSFSSIAGKGDWIVKLLAESGCRIISLGIESLEDADLISWNKKGQKQDQLYTVLEQLHQEGIEFHVNLMFGSDNQGLDYFKKVEDFIKRHNILGLQPSILYPYPKTETYDEWETEGRFYYYPKHSYNMHASLLHVPPMMSREKFADEFMAFFYKVNDPAEVLKRYEYVVTHYNTDKRNRTKPMLRYFCLLWLLGVFLKNGVDQKTIIRSFMALLKANDIRPLFCIMGAALLSRYKEVFNKSNILVEYDEDPVYGEAYYKLTGEGE